MASAIFVGISRGDWNGLIGEVWWTDYCFLQLIFCHIPCLIKLFFVFSPVISLMFSDVLFLTADIFFHISWLDQIVFRHLFCSTGSCFVIFASRCSIFVMYSVSSMIFSPKNPCELLPETLLKYV